jgi:3-deoxy-D-manno-octulosonic-acid transferase
MTLGAAVRPRLPRPVMFLAYSLLFTAGLILTAPYYLWRLRGHILSDAGWLDRFGFLPETFQQPDTRRPSGSQGGGGPIWVHAVSVGETLAVVRLVRELERRHPERRIFMSHVTPAGREAGEKRLPSALARGGRATGERDSGATCPVAGRFFLPLDLRWCVTRALERIRPAMLIIVETELWPNLLRSAHERGTRVVLVNARLSDGSFRGYGRFRFFIRCVLEHVDAVCAQTARDAERFQLLGLPAERVMVAGNVKFDAAPPQLGALPGILKRSLQASRRSPVVVAGSTMPGEEELVLEAWREIRRRYPQALLILAPRHPTRFESAAHLLSASGVRFVRRTALETFEPERCAQLADQEILLLDTVGELAGMFELADVVFVGGSLVPAGGHNLLEPAYWGKPVMFGPHMQNFRDIARTLLEAGAARQVENVSELAREAMGLLEDASLRREMGMRAKQVMQRESGATERILQRLDQFL